MDPRTPALLARVRAMALCAEIEAGGAPQLWRFRRVFLPLVCPRAPAGKEPPFDAGQVDADLASLVTLLTPPTSPATPTPSRPSRSEVRDEKKL